MDDEVTEAAPKPGDEPVKHAPPPVADTSESKDELRARVDTLSNRVEELSNTVHSLIESGGQQQDSKPVKQAWIHRKVF